MPMTVPVALARLRREVPAAEQSFDDTLLRTTELMQTILVARRESGVAVHAGQAALIRLAQSQRDLIAAASNMFRVHDELVKVGREYCAPDEDYSPESGLIDDSLDSTARAA